MNSRRPLIPESKMNAKSAFGYTIGQLLEIQQRQIDKAVRLIPANNAERFQDKYFEEEYAGYEIAEHDAVHFHVALEARTFDPQTGVKLSVPHVQIFDQPTFDFMANMKPISGFHGKLMHILHDPRKNLI